MIPPSDLYRIPRGDAARRRDGAAAFARLEYGSSAIAWMLPAPDPHTLWTRIRIRFAMALGRSRALPGTSHGHGTALRPAPQPAGEEPHPAHALPDSHPHAAWEALPAPSLVLPVLETDEDRSAL